MTSLLDRGWPLWEMGEFYFLPPQNDPFKKHWHYNSDGNKTYTMLKKKNSFMEGFRKWRLHGPKEAASSSGERTMVTPSIGDAVTSLIADEKNASCLQCNWYTETVDNIDSMLSGSTSPDVGDTWRQGCPTNPEWEGELKRVVRR